MSASSSDDVSELPVLEELPGSEPEEELLELAERVDTVTVSPSDTVVGLQPVTMADPELSPLKLTLKGRLKERSVLTVMPS